MTTTTTARPIATADDIATARRVDLLPFLKQHDAYAGHSGDSVGELRDHARTVLAALATTPPPAAPMPADVDDQDDPAPTDPAPARPGVRAVLAAIGPNVAAVAVIVLAAVGAVLACASTTPAHPTTPTHTTPPPTAPPTTAPPTTRPAPTTTAPTHPTMAPATMQAVAADVTRCAANGWTCHVEWLGDTYGWHTTPTAPLPPCPTEDATVHPCHWNAQRQGNHIGTSFTVLTDGTVIYP